jgi:hypothetical protein
MWALGVRSSVYRTLVIRFGAHSFTRSMRERALNDARSSGRRHRRYLHSGTSIMARTCQAIGNRSEAVAADGDRQPKV